MTEKKKNSRFWIIYCSFDEVQFEEHKFYSLLQAEKEAKRLAIENPNYEFFVLESVGVAAVTDAVYTKF